jgi:hypothetical protein
MKYFLCMNAGYDKLELPFPENGLVEVAMDFDSIQVHIALQVHAYPR